MSVTKDPAIKLFGKTIPLPPPNEEVSGTDASATTDADASRDFNLLSSTTSSEDKSSEHGENKKPSGREPSENQQENGASHQISEDINDPTTMSGISENPKTHSVDKENSALGSPKNGEQSETSISEDKTLKKPDKILPCPRCNSMDTKFCYYNNYNVNQPRHFCKNCQRYWTAGGTMRNVPVGAGRRKNKHSSASYYRHIMVSEALQSARADATNGVHCPTLGNNSTVLNFCPDAPPSESMDSVLNLAEKTQNCVRNGFQKPEQKIHVCGGIENGDDHSSNSTTTATNSTEKGSSAGLQESVMKNFQGFPPQVPCFPGPPWPCPWNSAQWNSGMPPSAFYPSGFPVSFYPAPTYWGCTVPGSWNVPWLSQPPTSPNHSSLSSSLNSPTLGKHSRNGDILNPSNSETEEPSKENNSERCVWIPKTLRIDDPSDAAKSSIWATLGIRNEKTNSISGGGLFKAFQSKGSEKGHFAETSPVLQANPAALSRSLNFHEST
ncbi:hypothetical protein L1049_005615 [Liquidambar formosana]|uniref:Dof-type domain-containing protein n=1 Tax=Liquidambar formosana TaxID=63359 RepID=A0AAP0WQ71_LIQFO